MIFPISPQYREHDVSYDLVSAHLRNGLSFEEAVRLASEKRKADDFNETCRSFGVDSTTMKRRMTKGSSSRLPQIVRTAQKRACVRLFCSSGEAQR